MSGWSPVSAKAMTAVVGAAAVGPMPCLGPQRKDSLPVEMLVDLIAFPVA